ncbi:MAG: NosD domain-containing protein [Thermoplasmata archaeon]
MQAEKRIWILGVFLLLTLNAGYDASAAPQNNLRAPGEQGIFQLQEHSPIHINGNMDFAIQAANENWQGDGSLENPYIIEGYEIDAQGGSYCVWIENTDVYFVVRNCLLWNATETATTPQGCGIFLSGVTNGKIENTICTISNYGILMSSALDTVLKGNDIWLNNYGIYATYSYYNQIVKNTIEDNTGWGITLDMSDMNELIENTLKNNSGGIFLLNTFSNLIRNHNISENQGYGVLLQSASGTRVLYNTFYKNLDYGVVVGGSGYWNSVYYNNFVSNNGACRGVTGNCQAFDDTGYTQWYDWNANLGNYWSNWDGQGWGNPDAYPIDGGAGASDWYPSAEPIVPPAPPIHITGDADFATWAAEYGWAGNGTEENPYIIENSTIDFTGGNYGIWIEHTEVHFVIRNCSLRGSNLWSGEPYGSGIALANVKNAKIENNTCNITNIGIYVYDFSANIYIANNTIIDAEEHGISLDSVRNGTITGNTITGSSFAGIFITASEGLKFSGNNMRGCGFEIEGYDVVHWVNNEIDTTNLVNGKPVYFFKNQNGLSFSQECGQVIIANSTNITVANLSFADCTIAIAMAYASSNKLVNNTISSCVNGLSLLYSHSNIIERNTITDNREMGIRITSCYTNTISENTVTGNGFNGISAILSSGNIITNNILSRNGASGINLVLAETNTIVYNELHENFGQGIALGYMSNGNFIGWNNVSSGETGIYLEFGTNNILRGNNLTNCGIKLAGDYIENWNTHEIDTLNLVNGKPVYYYKNLTAGMVPKDAGQVILANCTGILVENITAANCTVAIALGFSSGNLVRNAVVENCSSGIYISHSNLNKVENSSFTANYEGIYLWASDNNTITKCKVANGSAGIRIESCFSNNISMNDIKGTYEGISMWDSFHHKITNNTFKENFYGLALYNSGNNTIFQNTFEANQGYGVAIYWGSEGNLIYRNNFIANNGAGKGPIGNCQAYDSGGPNFWYASTTQEGNYWSNWDGQGWGTPDAYPIDGGAGASDWYPLNLPVREGSALPAALLCALLPLAILIGSRKKRKVL